MGFQIENGVLKKYTEDPGVTKVTIPEGVQEIGKYAFADGSKISTVTIPMSVVTIGDGAFRGCERLKSLVLPDSVVTIGDGAFSGCERLKSLVLPDSVTSIGEHAFSECSSLTDVTLPNGITAIPMDAFYHCEKLTQIIIPENVTFIGVRAFCGCKHLTTVVLHKGVTIIGGGAFEGCEKLTSITIPESVTRIHEGAFRKCKSLTSIVIPRSLKDIPGILANTTDSTLGGGTFEGCSSLTSITIPDGLTVYKNTFSKCCLQEVHASSEAMMHVEDVDVWIAAIKSLEPEKLLKAFKKCPKKLIPALEKRIMEYKGISAIRYFEQVSKLDEYAAFHNTDADTLRDSILSDFGLDENGCKSWPLAGSFVTARMEKDLSITLLDAQGKELKSLPKKGAEPAEFDTAKKEFAQLKKDIPAAAKLRNNRLLADFLEARQRSAESWKATYLKNPLLKALAKLVVWQQGANTFILNGNGTPVDAAGNDAALSDEPILLAHPMEMGAETTKAWQDYFLNHHLSQPFAQVWEPVLDGTSIRPDRYESTTIPLYMLMNKDLHGIVMEGQSRLRLRDCSADLKLMSSSTDWVNNQFEISNFRFEKFTRAVNHIAAHFDKGTVQGRLLKDDASAAQWLDYFTLAQITEFINLVTEKGDCPNSAAALLEYKNAKYPDADPFAEFVLDL